MFSGPNSLPAGGEERPGELEERPREEDQNVGVRSEAREVGVDPPPHYPISPPATRRNLH